MIEAQNLKLTDLDCLVGSHRLQMIKAALPYIQVPEQKAFSLFVKLNELERTMELFHQNEEGQVGICSLENQPTSPLDMLNAIKPYGTAKEQESIDLITNFIQGFRLYRTYQETVGDANNKEKENGRSFPLEQLKNLLSPEQQSRFENMELMMQAVQQFS